VSRHPDFHDLVGNELEPGERERLERVHELLIAAGPPPELPQELAEPPRPEGKLVELARRRLRTGLVLAATIVLAAFAVGYLFGSSGDESTSSESFTAERTAVLGKSPERLAVVRIGGVDENGNRPMIVSVDGLDRLQDGDYYTLFMTRNGKPIVTCGTFNVGENGVTTLRLSVAYDVDRFDGLMLAKYSREQHKNTPLLRAKLT
jgi:hypothetical protein